MANNFRTIRAKLRTELSTRPVLYFPLVRIWRWSPRENIMSADTQIVIEGFPRSGNTFAVYAFRFAQSKPVKIAHHLHAAAQVLSAIRRGIPTIVLIRRPKDAISSLVLRNPEFSLSTAFEDYFAFYRALLGKPGFVIAKFEDVVTDFGAIISRANKRFGTNFIPFSPTEENNQKVFELIEKRHMEITKNQSVNEFMVARPSEAKNQAKQHIEDAIVTTYAKTLQRAEELWKDFCAQG